MLKGNPFSKQLITILSILAISMTLHSADSEELLAKTNLSKENITTNIASMPLAFTANHGQWNDKVLFRANAGGATMWFSSDGAYYQFTRSISKDETQAGPVDQMYTSGRPASGGSPSAPDINREPEQFETVMIKATFVGANPNPQMIGVDMMDYKCNYFIGNDPNEWHTDVPNYSALLYEQVYDGIDLKYYGNGKQMEYDFIVSPGADYSQITIQYDGAESVSINDNGELVIETKWGEVVEQTPVIYQLENNSRTAVGGEYKMMSDNSFGFELSSSYNPALPLVIDPVLTYSTYLGGNHTDKAMAIAVDGFGNAYVCGHTRSNNFPTKGEYRLYQGDYDVFVTKLNNTGNSLIYSTYIGERALDVAYDMAVDLSGNVYITGYTNSEWFPIAGPFGPYQAEIGASFEAAFVTKLNSSGNGLLYSTYLGGSGVDRGSGIAVDGSGNAYITGLTASNDFPTEGEYQADQGDTDAFVTKLNSTGNALVYSTYLGGIQVDFARGIALDSSGNAYIIGYTHSFDFPAEGEYQTVEGGWDAFLTKLNSSGNALVYSTFIGGSFAESYYDIAVDGSGNAYITGITNSPDFPTVGEYQSYLKGGWDTFVTKLNSSGSALIYSTYLGGSNDDYGFAIAVDSSGNAYITGYTKSNDFPIADEFRIGQDLDYANYDAFVTKLNSSGNALVYSTYLGGNKTDYGLGIEVNDSGYAYIAGGTFSYNFPITGEYQTDQGSLDAFVTKLGCCLGNRGDLNGDGNNANILDLTFLVDFTFRGSGKSSTCPEESDLNGDGVSSNILDLTFLVDRIFRGGPAPGPC